MIETDNILLANLIDSTYLTYSSSKIQIITHIQGLRGVAIISVVLFHLWPTWFPNGYLGVDIFFVLSGYLMALIFSKESEVSLKTAYQFYCKRIQRIFPLYYIVVPLIFFCCQLFLTRGWIEVNNGHSFYAMCLLKNMETISLNSDYFHSFNIGAPQKDYYLHTWSLAVEIQFYLIVPVVFWILSFFPSKTAKIGVLTLFSTFSYCHYHKGTPTVAFNCPLARMWQFCIGMIVFMITEPGKEKYQKVSMHADSLPRPTVALILRPVLLVISIALLVFPLKLADYATRPVITVLVGYLLTVKNGDNFFKTVLQNHVITYIGDISYTIYLVHWPLILLLVGYEPASYIFAIFYIAAISVFLYHFYESYYRRISRKHVFLLTAALMLLNAGLYYSANNSTSVQKFYNNINIIKLEPELEELVKQNEELAKTPLRRGPMSYNATASAIHPAFDGYWGVFDFPPGHGDKRILVIGNSYAMMEADVIRQEFKGNYSEFRLISGICLFVLYEFIINPIQIGQHEASLKVLEEFKPDYVFIVTRFDESQTNPITISEDKYVREYNANIARIAKATNERVFIQGPSPPYPVFHLMRFIDSLIAKEDLSRFHLSKKEADAKMLPNFHRLQAMNCTKCEIYETSSAFIEEGRYLGFDPLTKLSYVDNSIHLTDPGLEKMRSVFTKVVESL